MLRKNNKNNWDGYYSDISDTSDSNDSSDSNENLLYNEEYKDQLRYFKNIEYQHIQMETIIKKKKERIEKAKIEKERKEKERLLEKERLNKLRLEKARLEKERIEKAKIEKERKEKERKEKERLLEKERLEKVRLKKDRLEKARLEKVRLEKDRKEKERLLEKERLNKLRLEKSRLEKERIEKAKIEKSRLEKERKEKERLEKVRLKKDRLEKARLEKVRLEKDRKEKERLEKVRLEKARLGKARLEKVRLEKASLGKKRKEKERKIRLDKIRLEKDRKEKERLEKVRLEKARLEKNRIEKEIKLKELEKEKMKRIERERKERERKKLERRERERKKLERKKLERKESERKERERMELERKKHERMERERRIRMKLRRDKRDKLIEYKNNKRESERKERERKEHERKERVRKEQERKERERRESERRERERKEHEKEERERRERERKDSVRKEQERKIKDEMIKYQKEDLKIKQDLTKALNEKRKYQESIVQDIKNDLELKKSKSKSRIFKKTILICRILGNDVPDLHGNNQTMKNLLFTLENEAEFPQTDKIYLLNRIFDLEKKNEIIKLLNKFNQKYIDIPFKIKEYNKLPEIKHIDINSKNFMKESYIKNKEKMLYLININNARNYCVNYGIKNGYLYTFPLDSNSFFLESDYNKILDDMKNKTYEYIVVEQRRLSESNILSNDIVYDKNITDKLPTREPQIGIRITAPLLFNENLPYGYMNKAELLNAIGSKGVWNKWSLNYFDLGFKQRRINTNIINSGKIYRLNNFNKNYDFKNNPKLRQLGIVKLDEIIKYKYLFENIYLINMETRRDRHLFMDYKLKNMGINYKRIPGVIGKHFEEEFNEFKKVNNTFNSIGAYGIFLTYKNIISKLYSLDSHVVIFEDDIVFHKDFHAKIKKYKQLIVNTDVVWLGVNRSAWGNNIKESNNDYFVADVTNYPDYLNWGAYGIIYSSRFLRALDKEINGEIENINLIDKFISYILKKNPQFTNVAFKSDLIIPQVYESDNMGSRDVEKMSIERRWDLNNLYYLNETAYFKDYYTKIMNNYSLRNDEKKDIENTLSNYDISKIVEDNNKSFVFFYKFNNIENLERFIKSVDYQDYVFYRIYILCSDDEWSVINDTDILISMKNKVKNIEGELTKSIILDVCYDDEICILLKENEFIVNIKDTLRFFSLTCRDSNVCLSYNNTYYNLKNEKLDHYHDVQITTDNNDILFFRSISINYLKQEYNDIEDIYLFFDSDKRTENNENMNDKKLLKLINPLNKGKQLDLTIGIPVYKLEDYTFLHTLCDSLKDKNIEIIFINDKQNKDDELVKLSEKYENIYVLNNGINQGAGITRNRILNHTFIRGEYLYFFDCDDFLYTDNFLTCLKIIMDKKYDTLYFKWERNNKINYSQKKKWNSFEVAKENIISPGIGMNPWWYITKSSIVLNNKIRFGETQIQNDVNYGVLVIHYSEKLHFEDIYVVNYNGDNLNNITNSKRDRSSTIISSYNTICELKQIESPLLKRFIHYIKYGIYPWNRQKTNNVEEYENLYNLYLSSYVDTK